jgi:hypothetical protein
VVKCCGGGNMSSGVTVGDGGRWNSKIVSWECCEVQDVVDVVECCGRGRLIAGL